MSILQLFKVRAGITTPPPPPGPALLEARARLRDAHPARDRAAYELRAAEERVNAANRVIEDADAAARDCDSAEATARSASQAWVAGGTKEEERPSQDLLDRAAATRNRAIGARILAEGARKALPGLEQADRVARAALERADNAVRAAAAGVQVAMLEPQFTRLEQALEVYDEALAEILACARSQAIRNYPLGSSGRPSELLGRVRDLMPSAPRDVKELMETGQALDVKSWREFSRRLIEEPEAQRE